MTELSFLLQSVPMSWFLGTIICIGVLSVVSILYVMFYVRKQTQALTTVAQERARELDLQNRQLELANEELQEVNRIKNKFLSIAAHDLKNPLFSIVGFSQLLNDEVKDLTVDLNSVRERHLEILDHIQSSSQRMLSIITNLLETTAEENRLVEIRPIRTNLELIVRPVIEANKVLAEKKGITLVYDSTGDCHADVDHDRIRAVFDNLLSNAIKYSPENTKVNIELVGPVDGTGNSVRFSVKDQGPGLADTDFRNLFGKFQRLSAQPTKGEDTTGLGLWIVKTLVELHGGKVWAVNNPDKGATFSVALPKNRIEQSRWY